MVATKAGKKTKNFRVRIFTLLIVMFLIWAVATIYNQQNGIANIKNELNTLNHEKEKVVLNNKKLKEKVNLLQSDEHIAQLARKYYFLSKPGEILIISPE